VARRDGGGLRLRVLMEPRHGSRYDDILALALATERAGFEAFFRSDHLMGVDPGDMSYEPTDCWTTLAGLARDTERVRLGSLVTAATFRPPGLLATIVSTVDQMSGGRVELGIGTGWYAREHAAFGIGFPETRERFDRFEEQLAIITGLWGAPQDFSFSGKHYRVEGNHSGPRVTQSPRPPIIIGGAGRKRTPALAARYADEFNGALGGDLRERFERFARACEEIGRDPDEPRRSAVLPVACGTTAADRKRRAAVMGGDLIVANSAVGTPEQIAERVIALGDVGADTVYLHIYDIHDLDQVALLGAEVLPHVTAAGLERTGVLP
jgi:F420-dependent oxidoreductase-like protein